MLVAVWAQLSGAPAAIASGCSATVCEGWAGLPLTSETQLPLVCEGEWDLAICLHTPTLLKSS